MTPQVFDVNGAPRDWAWLQAKYKCGMTAAPALTTAFRLVRVDETIGPAVFIVNVRIEDGAPQTNQPVAQWWPGAESDERSTSLVGVGLQSVYHPRAIVERTNSGGDIGFPYGAGGVIHENGPYEFWVLSPSYPSDAVTGLGWLGGTDHACPGRLTFQIVEGAPPPDPDPDPEPEPEPDPEPDDDAAWKRDVLEMLTSLYVRIDDLATHLGAL
jgi:hypothetical protein